MSRVCWLQLIGGADMYVPMCRACFLGDSQASGTIHITTGPMFSGKSSDLLRRVRRMQHAKKRCLLVKYRADSRYSEVRPHSGPPSPLLSPPLPSSPLLPPTLLHPQPYPLRLLSLTRTLRAPPPPVPLRTVSRPMTSKC